MGSESVTQTLEQLNLQDLISRLEDIITKSSQTISRLGRISKKLLSTPQGDSNTDELVSQLPILTACG